MAVTTRRRGALPGMNQATNSYLEQVLREKVAVEEGLKARRRSAPVFDADDAIPAARAAGLMPAMALHSGGGGRPDPVSAAVEVRVTGALWWRSVVVPPNAYVVHTRRGHPEPLHIGLGISFRFNPRTDAFLVVPSAMQTILINANCICRERQGLLVQGYVQWAIDDFATAYHTLDFSDEEEPMRVVNVQLREQAEAAIKDTVATMSIDDVLTDKQPIIAELTTRLRSVAEGAGTSGKGLGLRIVTVQIKEAVVCSPRVWENLQRPYRAHQTKQARLPELATQQEIEAKEHEAERRRAELEIAAAAERGRLEAEAEAQRFARAQADRALRTEQEAEALARVEAHQRAKLQQEHALARLALEQELALEQLRLQVERLRAEQGIALARAQRAVDNDHSEAALRLALIQRLPAVLEAQPKPEHLAQLQFGEDLMGRLLSAVAPRS
jgi:flotillin